MKTLLGENITHRFCVQYIYTNVINKKLSSSQSAWNVHVDSLRTEKNKSPRQLWLEGILKNYSTITTAVHDIFDTDMTLCEKLSEPLQILGVDFSLSIINNMSLLFSYFITILQISGE